MRIRSCASRTVPPDRRRCRARPAHAPPARPGSPPTRSARPHRQTPTDGRQPRAARAVRRRHRSHHGVARLRADRRRPLLRQFEQGPRAKTGNHPTALPAHAPPRRQALGSSVLTSSSASPLANGPSSSRRRRSAVTPERAIRSAKPRSATAGHLRSTQAAPSVMGGAYEVVAKRERELVDPLHVVDENQRRTDHAKRTVRGLEDPQRLQRSRLLPIVTQEQRLQPARPAVAASASKRSEAAASGTAFRLVANDVEPVRQARLRSSLCQQPALPAARVAYNYRSRDLPAAAAAAISPSSASSSRRPTNALIYQSVRRVQKRRNGLNGPVFFFFLWSPVKTGKTADHGRKGRRFSPVKGLRSHPAAVLTRPCLAGPDRDPWPSAQTSTATGSSHL